MNKNKLNTKTKLSISIGGFLFFLLLLEIGLRLGGYLFIQQRLYPQSKIGKQENVQMNILALGDSYTVGSSGIPANSYPSQLQKMFSASGVLDKYRLINGGVCEANTTQVFYNLTNLLKNEKIDNIILLAGATNKFNLSGYTRGKIHNKFSQLRVLKLIKIFRTNLKGKMLQHHAKTYYRNKSKQNDHPEYYQERFCQELKHILEKGRVGPSMSNELDVCSFGSSKESVNVDLLYRKARSIISNQHNPLIQNILRLVGEYYQDTGRQSDAIALYENVLKNTPSQSWAYNELGMAYLSSRKYDQAFKLYKSAELLKFPGVEKHITGWWGNYYHAQNEYTKAIHFYQKAIELNYDLDRHYELLSEIYLKKGDYAKAFEALFKAIESNSEEEYLYYLLAKSYELQNKYNVNFVIERLEALLAQNPELYGKKFILDYIAYYQDKRNKEAKISEWLEKDLDRIVQLSLENGIGVIVQNYPYPYIEANQHLENIAQKYSLPFINNYEYFQKLDNSESYFLDSDHLTDEGHRMMAKNIYNYFINFN